MLKVVMKTNQLCIILLFSVLLTACQSFHIIVLNEVELKQLTNEQIVELNLQSCQRQDKHNLVLKQNHPLQVQLTKLVEIFPNSMNKREIHYQIYLNSQPTASSSLNGCVRINSSLMEMLTDNEIQAVVAHEIAHIALNHSIVAFRRAKSAEINAYGEVILVVPQSLAHQQELEADEYAFNMLVQYNINPKALTTMLDKLDAYQKELSNSHPAIAARKQNLLDKNIK